MQHLADHKRDGPAPADMPDDVLCRLAGRVESALDRAPQDADGERRVLRIAEPLDHPVHPLRWLGAQPSDEQVYWSGREDGVRVAVAGAADLLGPGSPGGYDALRQCI